MPGLTMTDCSVADNVTQARYEFERAHGLPVESPSRDVLLCDWADKWGAAMIEVAAEHAGHDDDETVTVDDDEIDVLEDEMVEIRRRIRVAIKELESA